MTRRDVRQTQGLCCVIAAGGTGGHFFPAEALAAALRARGHGVVLMTDARSGATRSAVFAGLPVHVLRGAGIAGRGFVRKVRAVAAIVAGTLQARALLGSMRADCLIGFGGYPTVAPAMAARLTRRAPRLILHEQNAVLGRANRALAARSTCVALSFAATTRVPRGARCVLTGNPVRPAIAARAGSAYAPPGEGPVRLLVLGGSLGAHVLSVVVPAALALLPQAWRERLRVTQQCRAEDIAGVRAAYVACGIDAVLDSFFAEVAPLLEAAHLVIARAGASTVAELAVVGRPAILVPLPHAIDGHQAANAAALGEGAWTVAQNAFLPAPVATLIQRLLGDQDALVRAAAHAAGCGRALAAEALADLVEEVCVS